MYIIRDAFVNYLGAIKNRYKPHGNSKYITHVVDVLKNEVILPFFEPFKKTRGDFTHLKTIRYYHPEINDMSMYSTIISGSRDIELSEENMKEIEAIKEAYAQVFNETVVYYYKWYWHC